MRVILAYKNFAANRNISHIGLGVAAINTAKVLRHGGINTEVWPILSPADLDAKLAVTPVDHVIISAPWIPTTDLQELCIRYPNTQFAVNCHSNVGFLQADRNGVKLLREAMDLELGNSNFHLAGNSRRFCNWLQGVRRSLRLPPESVLSGAGANVGAARVHGRHAAHWCFRSARDR